MDLKDQSGEMSATFFGRAVDKYHGMLKPGQAARRWLGLGLRVSGGAEVGVGRIRWLVAVWEGE